jgi:hypothetical protein
MRASLAITMKKSPGNGSRRAGAQLDHSKGSYIALSTELIGPVQAC